MSETIKEKQEYSFKISSFFFISFFTLGLINNLGYVLILTCSQQFATLLDNPSLVALYPLALIVCSSLTRVVNSKFCIKVTYMKRLIGLTAYFLFGYLSLFSILHLVNSMPSFSKMAAFSLTLIPSLVMGTGCAFGEATILGYLRMFPTNFVSGWSSGTGLAGVGGAGITLLFKMVKIESKFLYLYLSPLCLIFFSAFYLTYYLQQNYKKDLHEISTDSKVDPLYDVSGDSRNDNVSEDKDTSSLVIKGTVPSDLEATDVKENKEMSLINFKIAFTKGKRPIINLALVYFLEYTVLNGFGERVSHYGNIEDKIFKEYMFEAFSLCYQIGVLISRSSLIIVKRISWVEAFTLLQLLNFVLWLIEVYYPFITYSWVAFVLLIEVGLLGGGAYVGCFYFILNSQEIDKNIIELCMNIGTIFNDIGVLISSLTVLLLDNTIMK